ncbi:hypothetical protein HMPREF1551_00188 [Capnocytophaga sp. oral taxon 863 str. F0517]|nr:hypothetical protein HMPREF1551_00188 [Capnocytophaga sp. oral taxon 863 str. F0517]
MVIYLPLVYIQKNNILFRFRKALFMKDILKYIGTILGIIFLLIIVIDFATYTWPNEPDSITLLFYKNRYWVFLFSVICAIIIKAEAVISYFLVILTIVSFVLTAIYDGIFTHTLPFKKDTYTYKWWCMVWEYKIYIAIGLVGMIVLELLIKKLIDYIKYRRSIPKAPKKEVVYKDNTKSLSSIPNNASGYKQIYNNLSSNIGKELNDRIRQLSDSLAKSNFKHKDIIKRINKSREDINNLNNELKNKILGLRNIHEWSKYTISFFGETNAGKSTIIESLRILLKDKDKTKEYEKFEKILVGKKQIEDRIKEVELKIKSYKDKNKFLHFIPLFFINRKYKSLNNKISKVFKKLSEFKDGEIIGTGRQDFTKSSKAYNFFYKNRDFVLIDVPGIEGDEGKYKDMIINAVSPSHTVFYVVFGKVPESGTIEKIKMYLKQQAEVYCIINKRGFKYSPEDINKTSDQLNYEPELAREVDYKMTEVLGDFYKGSITIQALLAFYGASKTIPYSLNEKHIKNRNKFLEVFKRQETLIEKSNISRISHLILSSLGNIDRKIYNINIDKIIACLDFFIGEIRKIRDEHYSDNLIEQINQQVISTNRRISNIEDLSNGLKHKEAQIVREVFNDCKEEINRYIDKFKIDRERIKSFCESTIKRRIKEIINLYEEEVRQQREYKKNNINKEIEFLSDRINDLQRSNANGSVNISYMPKIEIPEIEIKGKFVGIGMSVGAFFGPWGPAIGAAIGAVIEYLVNIFGGEESRKAKIKNNISVELDKIRGHILNEIGNSRGEIIAQIKKDIIQPVIEENKQVVVRYRNLQNMFNENIKFLNDQKNNLENEKHRRY